MAKTQVYSWRLSSRLKNELEAVARQEEIPMSELLTDIVQSYLASRRDPEDEEHQRRLRQAAAPHIGAVAGGDPERSEKARRSIRERLARERG